MKVKVKKSSLFPRRRKSIGNEKEVTYSFGSVRLVKPRRTPITQDSIEDFSPDRMSVAGKRTQSIERVGKSIRRDNLKRSVMVGKPEVAGADQDDGKKEEDRMEEEGVGIFSGEGILSAVGFSHEGFESPGFSKEENGERNGLPPTQPFFPTSTANDEAIDRGAVSLKHEGYDPNVTLSQLYSNFRRSEGEEPFVEEEGPKEDELMESCEGKEVEKRDAVEQEELKEGRNEGQGTEEAFGDEDRGEMKDPNSDGEGESGVDVERGVDSADEEDKAEYRQRRRRELSHVFGFPSRLQQILDDRAEWKLREEEPQEYERRQQMSGTPEISRGTEIILIPCLKLGT